MQFVALLSAVLSVAQAYSVLKPTNATVADQGSLLQVQWDMVDTDPELMDIYLAHTAVGTPLLTPLATGVKGDSGSYTVQLPTNLKGDSHYQINLSRQGNFLVIYAQSEQFTITNRTSSNSSGSAGPAPTSISKKTATAAPTVTVIEPVTVVVPGEAKTVYVTKYNTIDCSVPTGQPPSGGNTPSHGGHPVNPAPVNPAPVNPAKPVSPGGNGTRGGITPSSGSNKVGYTFTLVSLLSVSATYFLLM